MPLDFVGDAICLSGLTGTKLKCDVIGVYYSFWWNITSGGPKVGHRYPTAIVELNAATGEDYIEETRETVLGSAGHALELKVGEAPKKANLKVVLVEEHPACYAHLKNVIRRRWSGISVREAEGPITSNTSNVYLLNKSLDEALDAIRNLKLGNVLFFFDPLRGVKYTTIKSVASNRMRYLFQIRTEFIIFVFTSDWFLGRDDFSPLPSTSKKSSWSSDEEKTVSEADVLFGNTQWRNHILNDNPIKDKERMLIELYRMRLLRWFRYVLPMPFNPKEDQTFHLILCSNYEAGVRATRDFYCSKTGNPKYSPNNPKAFGRFKKLHPELFEQITGNRRPLQWLALWKIVRDHERGICDLRCEDLRKVESDPLVRQILLDWLEKNKYLNRLDIEDAWGSSENRYILNWAILRERLGIDPPIPLKPLAPEDI